MNADQMKNPVDPGRGERMGKQADRPLKLDDIKKGRREEANGGQSPPSSGKNVDQTPFSFEAKFQGNADRIGPALRIDDAHQGHQADSKSM